VTAKFAAISCLITAGFFAGVVCAFGQDEDSMAGVQSRIGVERAAISELRQRQSAVEREKSLLVAEIEQEVRRISQLNHTIARAPRRVRAPQPLKKQASKPAPKPAKLPAVRRTITPPPAAAESFPEAPSIAEELPPEAVPAAPPFDARLIDAESQAEIDRLSSMKKDLVSEKDTLEHVVKQGF
jgi:hypothetical protein